MIPLSRRPDDGRRHPRRVLPGAVALALVLGSVAVAAPADAAPSSPASTAVRSDAPVRGGNLIVQISQDPGSLDPDASGNISTDTISHYIFEGLFALDAQSRPQPMLASGYTLSKDRKTYTFDLRKGVTFSDGTPVTSTDVVASLKYWMKQSSYGQPIKAILSSLTAPNAQTVVMSLTKPWPVPLVMAASDGAVVLKASIADKLTARGFSNTQVVGTGPYKLKSWAPGQSIVLERNDRYQSLKTKSSAYAGAKHAYFDTITFKVVSDQDAIANGVETGLWNIATTPSVDQYDSLKKNPNVRVSTVSAGTNNIVFFNNSSKSIFGKQAARDALNLVMDKKAINAATGNPDLTTESGAWADKQNTDLYSTAGESTYRDYNPAEAKKLFKEAGYHGQTIRILTTGEFSQFPQWATLIQNELSRIGVKSKVETYDFGTMISKAKALQFDIMPLTDDGSVVLPQMSLVVTGLLPFLGVKGNYESSQMTSLINQYTEATSDATKKKLGGKIQALVWKEKPTLVMSMAKTYVAYTPKLKGYDHYGLDFWNSWLAK